MSTSTLVRERLNKVIAEVFGLPASQLPPDPSQQTVEGWDSLGHIRLIVSVEEEFGIEFHTEKIPILTSRDRLESEIEHGSR